MRIHELLEAQEWEKFKGSMSSRVWFNARTAQALTTNDDGNHSIGVTNNKQLFGVTDQELAELGFDPNQNAGDYDGRVLLAAMRKGWVRLYVDGRAPDMSSNAESTELAFLRPAVIWYCEQIGTPMRFVLVVRHGPGDKEGTPHVLKDREQVEWFIKRGTLPRDFLGPDQAQVRPTNTTPHAFRKF